MSIFYWQKYGLDILYTSHIERYTYGDNIYYLGGEYYEEKNIIDISDC